MPFYEYRCDACGHDVEALQTVNDEPLVDCPACGAATLRRIVSAPAFRLKGTGWYETDFKSGNKRHLADSGKDASKPETKTEAKTDAKPVDSKPAKP